MLFRSAPVPAGKMVLHRCDNPICVRPDHLFLGDAASNAADRQQKGRGASFPGEVNANSKLTSSQVGEIRARYAAGGVTQRELAAAYGIASQSHVSQIVRGVKWVEATRA